MTAPALSTALAGTGAELSLFDSMIERLSPKPEDEPDETKRKAIGAERAKDQLRRMPLQDWIPMPLPEQWRDASVWDAGPSYVPEIILRPSQLIALRPPRPYRIALYRCGRNYGKNFTAATTVNAVAQAAWAAIRAGKLAPGDATQLVCGRATDDTLDAGVSGWARAASSRPHRHGSRPSTWRAPAASSGATGRSRPS